MLDFGYFCMDCMKGMAELKTFKPFGIANYVRKIPCISFKRNKVFGKYAINLGNMYSCLSCYFRLIRNCFTQFFNMLVVLNSFFVIVLTPKAINTKINGGWHIPVKQIPNRASIQTNKGKNINFAVVIYTLIVSTVPLYVKYVCHSLLVSLGNNSWSKSCFHLNSKKPFAIIEKNIIRKSLFTWKSNKTFQNKVSTNKVFTSFTALQFFANSHNITSYILYHKYLEVASAISKYLQAVKDQISMFDGEVI